MMKLTKLEIEQKVFNLLVTQNELKEILNYDPETGIFTWKKLAKNSTKNIGDTAGCVIANKTTKISLLYAPEIKLGKSYLRIKIKSKTYLAQRLAFLFMTGKWPDYIVIHNDKDSLNNAWSNLLDVTYLENARNRKLDSRNTSGCTGVYWQIHNDKWKASIFANGKNKLLGFFDKKEDAIKAREKANVKYKFHKDHGKTYSL